MPFGVIVMCCMGGCGLMPLSGMVEMSSFDHAHTWQLVTETSREETYQEATCDQIYGRECKNGNAAPKADELQKYADAEDSAFLWRSGNSPFIESFIPGGSCALFSLYYFNGYFNSDYIGDRSSLCGFKSAVVSLVSATDPYRKLSPTMSDCPPYGATLFLRNHAWTQPVENS